MRRCRTAWSSAAVLSVATALAAPASADPELSLVGAVRETLEANLDLAARRRALAADREEIGITRAALLPQVDLGARGQILDDDRSDGNRGNVTQESFTVAAGLTQVLYDETDWADFTIQKRIYAQQQQQFESFRLGVVQDAAQTFLDLDRARAVLKIQQRNREVTVRNRETSKSRIAAGWSSEREVLRWDSQLATNDQDITTAQVQGLLDRFELNRVRNRPPEATVVPAAAGVGEYGFVYARDAIAQAVADPQADTRLRDFLVRVGLSRSPDLAAADEAIAAAERQLTASQRAFWVPSLVFGAGVDHLTTGGTGSSFNETEWTVGAGLSFPLLEGGAKFASLRQSAESMASLRTSRRATSESIDRSIRSAFAQASGDYANIGFAERQRAAARRNFELVDASYVLGVDSILDILDAQSQLLDADLAVTNARYDFLETVIAAERQMAFFPFLAPAADVERLLDDIEAELRSTP